MNVFLIVILLLTVGGIVWCLMVVVRRLKMFSLIGYLKKRDRKYLGKQFVAEIKKSVDEMPAKIDLYRAVMAARNFEGNLRYHIWDEDSDYEDLKFQASVLLRGELAKERINANREGCIF